MTENTEGAAGDLTADLAALRQDVARLAETASELVQHQVAYAQENVSAEAMPTLPKMDLRKHAS